MSNVDVRAALIQAVISLALPYPVRWPNDSQKPVPAGEPWVRATLSRLDGAGGSLGPGGRDAFNGSAEFKIFVPPATTDAEAYAIMDAIGAVVKRGAALHNGGAQVRIRNTGTRPGENLDGWYMTILRADFFAYVTRG